MYKCLERLKRVLSLSQVAMNLVITCFPSGGKLSIKLLRTLAVSSDKDCSLYFDNLLFDSSSLARISSKSDGEDDREELKERRESTKLFSAILMNS